MVLVNIIDVATLRVRSNRKGEGYKERELGHIFLQRKSIRPYIHNNSLFPWFGHCFISDDRVWCWLVVLWCWWWWLKMQQKNWSFIAYTQEAREKQTPPNPTTKYSIVPHVTHITEQSSGEIRELTENTLYFSIIILCSGYVILICSQYQYPCHYVGCSCWFHFMLKKYKMKRKLKREKGKSTTAISLFLTVFFQIKKIYLVKCGNGNNGGSVVHDMDFETLFQVRQHFKFWFTSSIALTI